MQLTPGIKRHINKTIIGSMHKWLFLYFSAVLLSFSFNGDAYAEEIPCNHIWCVLAEEGIGSDAMMEMCSHCFNTGASDRTVSESERPNGESGQGDHPGLFKASAVEESEKQEFSAGIPSAAIEEFVAAMEKINAELLRDYRVDGANEEEAGKLGTPEPLAKEIEEIKAELRRIERLKDEEEEKRKSEGHFTGKPVMTGKELIAVLEKIKAELRPFFENIWFANLQAYVDNYRNEKGEPDPVEALKAVMFAALLENNVYPFVMAGIEALALAPDDPELINMLIVGLLRLQYTEIVGRLLDVAYRLNPGLPHTFNNAASWYHAEGMVEPAIEMKEMVFSLQPLDYFALWNAAEYAKDQDQMDAYNRLISQIPENYPLKNSNGTFGGRAGPETVICCACNGKTYSRSDRGRCIKECRASLGCFSGICSPSECCGGIGPFTLGFKFCYPPVGAQACVSVSSDGSVTFEVQGNLPNLVQVGVGAKLSFSSEGVKSSIVVNGGVLGRNFGASIDLETYEIGTSFSQSGQFQNGTFGVSLGLPTVQQWIRSAGCL